MTWFIKGQEGARADLLTLMGNEQIKGNRQMTGDKSDIKAKGAVVH